MSKEKSKASFPLPCNSLVIPKSTCGLTNRNNDYSKFNLICQIENELQLKWNSKKVHSLYLSEIYNYLGLSSLSSRVFSCGSYLEFTSYSLPVFSANLQKNGNKEVKLTNANFCRDRLCPMCAWRRSYKVYSQLSQIIDFLNNKYSYLFLTLTVPNVSSDELSDAIDNINKGFSLLFKKKRVKTAVKGFFKALEITYNSKTNTFHPHLHVVLAVLPSYFTSRDYIKRSEWLQLWCESVNDFSITQVDIRKCYGTSDDDFTSSVSEVAKYSVKSSDYLRLDDFAYSVELVSVLHQVLKNRRLCSFGGVFKDVKHRLSLDDSENGDLVHLSGDLTGAVAAHVFYYGWSVGCYKLFDVSDC